MGKENKAWKIKQIAYGQIDDTSGGDVEPRFESNRASQGVLVVKNPRVSAGDIRDMGSIPESGSSPGKGNGNTLQCSCLENLLNRGSWQATDRTVAQSQTQLKCLSSQIEGLPRWCQW